MQTKNWGLGRGLESLLPAGRVDNSDERGADGVISVPLSRIKRNPQQPRKNFDDGALKELASSIKEHGIIEPVIVELTEAGNYLIVAGERRCRAALIAGLDTVPVIVRNYTQAKRFEISLIENIQREDLNPIEEARAYKHLIDSTGLTQDEAAAKIGKNRATIANVLRLLKLPPEIQDALRDGVITQGHARAILSINNAEQYLYAFNKITSSAFSVREAEALALEINSGVKLESPPTKEAKKVDAPARRDPHIVDMEEKFRVKLGTKVKIEGGAARGSISIDYYSLDDLNRLYELILR